MSSLIDLSTMPFPGVIQVLDYEALLAARLTRLKQRFAEEGVEWLMEALESDPAKILQEEDAYRQMLDLQRVNDALKAVLAAYSRGTNLDAIALRAGVTRLLVTPATETTPAVYETDAQLLIRYLASFDAPAAGSEDAYIATARKVAPGLRDVRPLRSTAPGEGGHVRVILLPVAGQSVSVDAINAVSRACNGKAACPMTDYVSVQAATVISYEVVAKLYVPAGPDPLVVRQQAETAIAAFADAHYKIAKKPTQIVMSAISAPLYAPNVSRVDLQSPSAAIDLAAGQAARMTSATVTVEVVS